MKTIQELLAFYGTDDVSIEFLEFDKIENKFSNRPDVHAFILLDKLLPGKRDILGAAEHDQVWLDIEIKELLKVATTEQLIELHRCGVTCGAEGLCMFV